MDIKTENLTILFTDIAGFTVATSQQSRQQQARFLATFNDALFPLIKRFKGRVVKTIGDALLITFRSPTDSMLCAMALQDGMHEINLGLPEQERIHIRVAASLGEVRVTKNDIFGEPVNLAARVESVTPADEIYLSEAVYLAMNKAEVPAQEVGVFDLAGISSKIKLYSIPRFATLRLVPQKTTPAAEGSELNYPYGGMHKRADFPAPSTMRKRIQSFTPAMPQAMRGAHPAWWGAAAGIALCLAGGYWFLRGGPVTESVATASAPSVYRTIAPVSSTPSGMSLAQQLFGLGGQGASVAAAPTVVPSSPSPAAFAFNQPLTGGTVSGAGQNQVVPPAVTSVDSAGSTDTQQVALNTQNAATEGTEVAPVPAFPTEAAAAKVEVKPTAKPRPVVWTVTSAKLAYKAGRLSKEGYRNIVTQLELNYEAKIRALKESYRARRISKQTYEDRVRAAKLAYKGG